MMSECPHTHVLIFSTCLFMGIGTIVESCYCTDCQRGVTFTTKITKDSLQTVFDNYNQALDSGGLNSREIIL